MPRGYAITSTDLSRVLCLNAAKDGFLMEDVVSTKVLNNALCFHDLTEAKNVLSKIQESEDHSGVVSDAEINNIARLYNKFY